MRLPTPLIPGRLIRRYKRFLADVERPDGAVITAHVANPGSMMGLAEPGSAVWLSKSADPKRKLPYSWELSSTEAGGWCMVNTGHANRIVEEALRARTVPALAAYGGVRREVRYGAGSRIDFLLEQDGLPPAYVEVKSVTLRREPELAEFPDAATARGAKHLRELAAQKAEGARAVLLYLLSRDDVSRFALAADIDPAYAAAAEAARTAGVEMLTCATRVTTTLACLEGEAEARIFDITLAAPQ